MEFASPVTQQGERFRSDWTVYDWSTNTNLSSIFDPVVRMSYEAGDVGVPDFTKAILTQTTVSGGSASLGVPKLRITNESALTGGNTRLLYPFKDSTCYNCEVRGLWMGRYRGTGVNSSAQCGFGLRNSVRISSGKPFSFHVWHDGIFSIESYINQDTWEQHPTTGALIQGTSLGTDAGGVDFPAQQVIRTVSFGSKQGTTITLNVGANHGLQVGDSCKILTDEITEDPIQVASLSGSTLVSFTSGTSATANIYNVGTGYVYNRVAMPKWVACRLIDDTLMVKAWTFETAEPDWDNPNFASKVVYPSGLYPDVPGKIGISAAHLTTQSVHYVDYGTIMWRSLD